ILDRTTYMISNSLGAMPRGVYEGLRGYADSWSDRGVRAWEEGWWEMAVGVGDQIAPLIGAGPGEISLHQNVTLTQAVISSCFDFRGPRHKLAMVELQFPSTWHFYQEHRRPFAFETGAIEPRDDSFRYLNGTPQIPALYACQPGLDIVNKAGIGAIRDKSMRMTLRLIEGARSRGWRVNTPENPAERAGT